MTVIVVGAGPTGLMLAGELAEAGVPVKILERRAEESNLTRAFGVNARTLELLDMRGMADELVAQGFPVPEVRPRYGRHQLRLGLRHPESRFPYLLIVQQASTEVLLERRVRRLGVPIVRDAEVTDLRQDADGVTLTLAGGRSERADYVVGCDGAHSTVRRLLAVGFSGRTYEHHILLADIRLTEDLPPAVGGFFGDKGVIALPPFGDGWYRAVIWDPAHQGVPLDEPLGIEEVRDSMRRIAERDLGVREMRWSTRFLSERRQADRYRVGRVFLAGDAAHVHSPLGALGMNTGIQDAANLGWKLAAAHHGWAPVDLLDSYETERHPVGRTALRATDAIQRLVLAPAWVRHVRPYLARVVLGFPPAARLLRRTLSGLGIAYDTPGSRLAGHRVGDLSLTVDGTRTRLYELARGGRFLLIDTRDPRAAAEGWRERVDPVRAEPADLSGSIDLPGPSGGAGRAGEPRTRGTTTLLVRPDGYLAWAATNPDTGQIRAVLRRWCGEPSSQPARIQETPR
jgi:2-polyprenyl-6-methoxyphenol hydroxylase-like FAD-dependent oxidoreductase